MDQNIQMGEKKMNARLLSNSLSFSLTSENGKTYYFGYMKTVFES